MLNHTHGERIFTKFTISISGILRKLLYLAGQGMLERKEEVIYKVGTELAISSQTLLNI